MKKFIFSLLIVSLLLVGCSKKMEVTDRELGVDLGRTTENSEMVDYLINNRLDTYSNKSNTFFVFSENGYFVRYYSTKIHFKSGNVLMIRGTWKFDKNNLTLDIIDRVEMVQNEDETDYVIRYEENHYQDHFDDLEFIKIGEKSYLSGSQSLREKNNIKNDNLYNEVKKYVQEGITNIDYEQLKKLDQENSSLNG